MEGFQGKEFSAGLEMVGELVKTQGGGAVVRFPGRAGPREKGFCGRGAGKGPSYISAIEFSKCP